MYIYIFIYKYIYIYIYTPRTPCEAYAHASGEYGWLGGSVYPTGQLKCIYT